MHTCNVAESTGRKKKILFSVYFCVQYLFLFRVYTWKAESTGRKKVCRPGTSNIRSRLCNRARNQHKTICKTNLNFLTAEIRRGFKVWVKGLCRKIFLHPFFPTVNPYLGRMVTGDLDKFKFSLIFLNFHFVLHMDIYTLS